VPRKGYASITLPVEFVAAIRNKIHEPHSLYTSVSDFTKEAIREKLDRQQSTTNSQHLKARASKRPSQLARPRK